MNDLEQRKIGHRERLRERFLNGDAASRTDDGLLELLLTFGIPRRDVQQIAQALLAQFGTLERVLAANESALRAVGGIESHTATLLKLVDHISRVRIATQNSEHGETSPAAPFRDALETNGTGPLHRMTQDEIPLSLSGQSELPLAPRAQSTRTRKTIQDAIINEGLFALKLSLDAHSIDDLHELLLKRLGQNSAETRSRYTQTIIRWFFPDGLTGLLPRVWRAYQDEPIALDLLRWSYLNQEPILGGCVAEALYACENGLVIPTTYFDKFLQDHMGEPPPEKTRKRLKSNLKKLGFLERAKGKSDRLLPVLSQKTSFLILLHHLFAPKAIRTVELKNLLANPFWKYLGHKSEDSVRALLREADAVGLIGKYIVADQLEQVTTCVTLDEFLERKDRL